MASSAALPPPLRGNNHTGSHMAVRNASSSRLARWQPYFLNGHSIPNKRALPSLVRPPILSSSARAPTPSQLPAPSPIHPAVTEQPKDGLPELTPAKPAREDSQLPTPTSSPPGMPPTLLEQTSSGYVLELSLAILASIYFQPGYQQVAPDPSSPECGEDAAAPVTSPRLRVPSTPTPESATTTPITPNRALPTSIPRGPSKDITPLTPQSPPPSLRQPSSLVSCQPPPPPQQSTIRVQCLPSKRELTRHLTSLGALESQPGAPAGSMRWFLTELFKRAALPGLIIRVAAGYVLRCRAAITQALHSVALKSQTISQPRPNPKASSVIPVLPVMDRTPQERVLTDARRVFLAALVLACKFVFDKPYDNRSWALISGLGSRDIGECERVVGEVLGWRLWIGAGRAPA